LIEYLVGWQPRQHHSLAAERQVKQ
jgi:hypothetical protein